jgi:hypothetical protein
MQFSILGVPFKCTKDMFTWEKAKWSFLTYWTIGWRGLALILSTLVLAFGILFLPSILGAIQDIPLGEDADFALRALLNFVLSLNFWKEHYLIPGIVLLALLVVALILGGIYIHYYGIFKKNYKSFNRDFAILTIPTFKSWNFWKRYIFVALFGFLSAIPVFGLILLEPHPLVKHLVNFFIGFVLFHVTLHGGTWGFVPVRKEAIVTESTSKS